jgi:hypothetical protein
MKEYDDIVQLLSHMRWHQYMLPVSVGYMSKQEK